METELIKNAMSFEESLKQISPSDKNAKPIKVSLLKQLRKRYYWRLENNQWVVLTLFIKNNDKLTQLMTLARLL